MCLLCFVAEIPVENAFIKRFEAAAYDRVLLARQHARVRRDAASTAGPKPLHLDVTAFNRYIRIDTRIISPFHSSAHVRVCLGRISEGRSKGLNEATFCLVLNMGFCFLNKTAP